jgi:hypothetical protein
MRAVDWVQDTCECCKPKPHHWIEEGSYEDFKRNIMESDLPCVVFGFASSGTLLANDFELIGIDLVVMPGTYVVGQQHPPFPILEQGQVMMRVDLAQVEPSVLQMLLARPEVQGV